MGISRIALKFEYILQFYILISLEIKYQLHKNSKCIHKSQKYNIFPLLRLMKNKKMRKIKSIQFLYRLKILIYRIILMRNLHL